MHIRNYWPGKYISTWDLWNSIFTEFGVLEVSIRVLGTLI